MSDNLSASDRDHVLLIGSGYMAREYLKVLLKLNCNVTIVGRGIEKIGLLSKEYPQFNYFPGGVEKYLKQATNIPLFAINAASVGELKRTSILLLKAGVKNLLIEKPGDLYAEGLIAIELVAKKNNAQVYIAYNRRFYSSILALQTEVLKDGGIVSSHFEFTEWIHTIDPEMYASEVLQKWIIANSSHVIDTAFLLIGKPKELHATVSGRNVIDWHRSGSVFTGSGLSENDIPFTYHSNWEAPGRWAIEINTRKRRFYLKPMEKLQVQSIGSVEVIMFPLDDQLDIEYKPGLFMQTRALLNLDFKNLVSLREQIDLIPFYYSIGGY